MTMKDKLKPPVATDNTIGYLKIPTPVVKVAAPDVTVDMKAPTITVDTTAMSAVLADFAAKMTQQL